MSEANGQIQKRPARPESELVSMLGALTPQFRRVVPKGMDADRLARIATTALRTVPKLAECTAQSFAACMMQTAQLGLEPCTPLGHAYLIPRANRKTGRQECTLIIGYQGMLDIARRSGAIDSIRAQAVYDGDVFDVEFGLNQSLVHRPAFGTPKDPSKLIAAYAVARLKGASEPVFVVLSRAEIEASRKRGASGHGFSTPWDTDYEAMALKTAIRRLFRWLPKSIESRDLAIAEHVDDARMSASVISPETAQALEMIGQPELAASYDEETGEVEAEVVQ